MTNPILKPYRNKNTGAVVYAAPYRPYGEDKGYEMYHKSGIGGPVTKEFFESTYEEVKKVMAGTKQIRLGRVALALRKLELSAEVMGELMEESRGDKASPFSEAMQARREGKLAGFQQAMKILLDEFPELREVET